MAIGVVKFQTETLTRNRLEGPPMPGVGWRVGYRLNGLKNYC
jgi:hypothetical protein